jgi:hypothetical protein
MYYDAAASEKVDARSSPRNAEHEQFFLVYGSAEGYAVAFPEGSKSETTNPCRKEVSRIFTFLKGGLPWHTYCSFLELWY